MAHTIAEPEPPAAPPRRPRRIRVLRAIGWASLIAGLFVLGFVVQQLVVTTWLADHNQQALTEQARSHFAEAEVKRVPRSQAGLVPPATPPPPPATPGDTATTTTAPPPEPTLLVESPPELHQAFAIIRIPKIEKLAKGWTVVEGVSLRDLKNGAGHMPKTPLPGQPGNAVISGHRTTHGAPFYDLDSLVPGDRIEVETAIGVHVYEVRERFVVSPFDLWVTNPRHGAWLTLTTCNPRFSSRQRLIVVAEMVDGPNMKVIYG